jgi:hypothetical protein
VGLSAFLRLLTLRGRGDDPFFRISFVPSRHGLFAIPPGHRDPHKLKRQMIFAQSFVPVDGSPQLMFFLG